MGTKWSSQILLAVVLLILAAGSGVAGGREATEPSGRVGAPSAPSADYPWFTAEVDTPGDTGLYPSVAADPSTGTTVVSYHETLYRDLRVAQYVGSGGNCGPNDSWLCHTIDSEGDVGKHSSIAVYPTLSLVEIAYHDADNGDLKFAIGTLPVTDHWTIFRIDKGVLPTSTGLYTSIGRTAGRLSIAYYSSGPGNADALRLATVVGGGGNCGYGTFTGLWQCDTIQTGEGVGQYASLVLEEDGTRHIAYYHGANGELYYATNSSGLNCGPGNSWTCYAVDEAEDVGQYASMYVDGAGQYHIAYYDAVGDALKYATHVGSGGNCGVYGSAQCDEIDSMMQGYNHLGLSMAEDAGGYPIVAYQSQYGSLNVARPLAAVGLAPGSGNCGPESLFATWRCETVDPHGDWITYRNGDYVSIAVNSSGLATIAYQGFITAAGGNLMVAYQQPVLAFLPLLVTNQ